MTFKHIKFLSQNRNYDDIIVSLNGNVPIFVGRQDVKVNCSDCIDCLYRISQQQIKITKMLSNDIVIEDVSTHNVVYYSKKRMTRGVPRVVQHGSTIAFWMEGKKYEELPHWIIDLSSMFDDNYPEPENCQYLYPNFSEKFDKEKFCYDVIYNFLCDNKIIIDFQQYNNVCRELSTILRIEKSLIDLPENKNYIVIGNINGNFKNLINILNTITLHFKPNETLYKLDTTGIIFLGDYFDGGDDGANILLCLGALKIINPSNVFLCRGGCEDFPIDKFAFPYHIHGVLDEHNVKKFYCSTNAGVSTMVPITISSLYSSLWKQFNNISENEVTSLYYRIQNNMFPYMAKVIALGKRIIFTHSISNAMLKRNDILTLVRPCKYFTIPNITSNLITPMTQTERSLYEDFDNIHEYLLKQNKYSLVFCAHGETNKNGFLHTVFMNPNNEQYNNISHLIYLSTPSYCYIESDQKNCVTVTQFETQQTILPNIATRQSSTDPFEKICPSFITTHANKQLIKLHETNERYFSVFSNEILLDNYTCNYPRNEKIINKTPNMIVPTLIEIFTKNTKQMQVANVSEQHYIANISVVKDIISNFKFNIDPPEKNYIWDNQFVDCNDFSKPVPFYKT